MLLQVGLAPVVILAGTDHEFQLIALREEAEILHAVARCLLRARRFYIDHSRYPGIHVLDIHGAAGLQRHVEACVAEAGQQRQTIRLCQRFPAGHAHVSSSENANLVDDGIEIAPVAGMKRVFGIAVLAAQRTTRQPHEHGGKTNRIGFPLQ